MYRGMIEVEGLSKSFQRRSGTNHRLRPQEKEATFWALKDLSFRLSPGEAVGLIGPNGAGKSTLLKILSGIYRPTSGRAILRGRVGSILDIGSGFHPELSGRENIYFAGQLAGLKKSKITALFPDIVEFSELEEHLDTPVKYYSSGMFLRLAFSTVLNIDCDIMLLDEVLAVGDANFQEKCFQKIQTLKQSGRAMLIASHNPGKLAQICDRVMVLNEGRKLLLADTSTALAFHAKTFATGAPLSFSQSSFLQNIAFEHATEGANSNEEKHILKAHVSLKPGKEMPFMVLALMDSHNSILFSANTLGHELPTGVEKVTLKWDFPAHFLNAGLFWANLYVINNGRLEEHYPKIGQFETPPFENQVRQLESQFHALHIEGGLQIEPA